mgnify:FL=1
MQQKYAPKIIDALSPDVLQHELGMTERSIRHAKSTGRFAAMWYRPIKELCESHGIYCPLDAFNWKQYAKNSGNPGENQGRGVDGMETHARGAE